MIDELDLKFIQELQKNGRQSNVQLAETVGVAEGTVRKRLERLVNNKLIKIAALPNPRQLGYNLICIMGMQVHMSDLRAVGDSLAQMPNVCYLAFVTGVYDLMAIVITKSPEELARFIEKEISAIPGIVRTETFVNLEVIKGGWPELDTTQLIGSLDGSLPGKDRKKGQ